MHPTGETCSFRAAHQIEDFTIIHTNGIHRIPVDFCGCEKGVAVPWHIQLMRLRLWPATCVNPQTATTHEALDQFTRLSLLGRLNVYDYYRALESATDGAGLGVIAVRVFSSIHDIAKILPAECSPTACHLCATIPTCTHVQALRSRSRAGWDCSYTYGCLCIALSRMP